MESIKNITKNNEEGSQSNLREKLEQRFLSKKVQIEELINEYKQSLKDGLFLDQYDEEEGAGEKRKIELQEKINSILDKAEKMKSRLDGAEILPSFTEEIESSFTFPDTGKIEQININIEQKLQEFISFYEKHKVEMPEDFEERILEIWENNIDDIEKEIKEHGFNEILLIPPTTDLPDLAEKMKESEYRLWSNFKEEGGFKKAKSQNQDKIRLVLTHYVQNLKDHPELKKTLNTKGQDVPLLQTLSQEEYLIFSKKYFEETGKHLDEIGLTWLATESGSGRLVYSYWGGGRRDVCALCFSYGIVHLGFRSSRSYSS
jgi:hypothetical protein